MSVRVWYKKSGQIFLRAFKGQFRTAEAAVGGKRGAAGAEVEHRMGARIED